MDMVDKALGYLLSNFGLLGIVCVLLIAAVIRLFTLLMASKENETKMAKDGMKETVEAMNEQTEAINNLASWVQGADRIGRRPL